MKTIPFNPFLIASNNAVADVINDVLGVFNELTLAEGEKEKRYLYPENRSRVGHRLA